MKIISRFNRKDIKELHVDESIFALQNGYLGVRGNFSEGYNQEDYKQTLINGFYNYYDYSYEENSPAFPQKGQRIINVIDGQSIDLYLDDKAINLENCKLENLERHFDLKKGITTRKAKYITKAGQIINVFEERLLSFIQKELLIIKLGISSPNYDGEIKIISRLKLPNKQVVDEHDSRINVSNNNEIHILNKQIEIDKAVLFSESTTSLLKLRVGMKHNVDFKYQISPNGINAEKCYKLEKNKQVEIIKYVAYITDTFDEMAELSVEDSLDKATLNGYKYYSNQQIFYLDDFWNKSDILIEGDDFLNKSVLYNIYQLNSSSVSNEHSSIPAKGLTGEGYEGHYFWDTEIYIIPFFILTNPDKAKNLLMCRYHQFEEGRKIARSHGATQGVKIPWRTINGKEVSPYYPSGSAQYHINSDLAYSIIKYFEYTNDINFITDYGFEMLVETARFLYDVGNFFDNKFQINNVTGPDEYTTLVNNNYYTNSMAKYHFNYLVKIYHEQFDKLSKSINRLSVTESEIEKFSEAAKIMALPFDENKKIWLQDDSFLQKKPLDFKQLPKEKFPLILHYHPLYIYKHQVLKQADTLLSLFLLDYDDLEIYNNSFDYYLPKTTHDSSLSRCIHSIIAFRLGHTDLGYKYLQDTVKIDLENTYNNTHHGLHIANSGGIYLSMVFGILGLRIKNGSILIRPSYIKKLEAINFKFFYKDTEIRITLNRKIQILVNKPIKLGIYNDMVLIKDKYQCDYI